MQQHDDSQTEAAGRAGVAQPPAAPAVSRLSNTDTANCRILRFGLDSLYLSYPGQLSEASAEMLDAKRQAAVSREDRIKAQAQIILCDHVFEVRPNGRGVFRYILSGASYRIELSATTSQKAPLAYCKIASQCLTHLGVEEAVKQLEAIVAELGTIDGIASVSRADLFTDFLYPPGIRDWTQDQWVTRADLVSTHFDKRRASGWSIAPGGDISARLYDKTIEIEKSEKEYLKPLWHQQGWEPPQAVYRLEFQLMHACLVQLQSGIYPALIERLGGIWAYCARDWLRLTTPNPSDDTRSRWPTHPLWLDLQAVPWKEGIKPERISLGTGSAPSDEYLTRAYISVLSSLMAAKQIRDPEEASEALFVMARDRHDSQAFISGKGFDEIVGDRARKKAVGYHVKTTPTPQELNNQENEYLKQTGKG